MHIVGIGTDIVDLKRIRNARYIARAAEFFFTDTELTDMRGSRDTAQFVASRLAAKEAVIKACPERLWYHDFSIVKKGEKLSVQLHKPLGKPYDIFVSIAHEFAYVVSNAVVSA